MRCGTQLGHAKCLVSRASHPRDLYGPLAPRETAARPTPFASGTHQPAATNPRTALACLIEHHRHHALDLMCSKTTKGVIDVNDRFQ